MPWTIDDHEASAVEAIERGVISGNPDHLKDVPEPTQSAEHQARVSSLSILNQLAGPDSVIDTPWTPTPVVEPPIEPPPTEPEYDLIVDPTTPNLAATVHNAGPSSHVKFLPGLYNGLSIVPVDGQYLYGVGAVLDGGDVQYAVNGAASGDTYEGFEIRNYQNPNQQGAVNLRGSTGEEGGTDRTVLGCEVHHNLGTGIKFFADRVTIDGCNVHHQHQLGIGGGGLDCVVEDTEIAFNNWLAEVSWGWEAGGTKFWSNDGLQIINCHSHDNHGPGLWSDHDNRNVLYENNLVEDNYANGIFHEISYSAVIRNNTIRRNGFSHDAWLWGAGILIAASEGVEAYGNLVEDCYNGITMVQQDRHNGELDAPYLVRNNLVHDNTIRRSGRTGAAQDISDTAIYHDNNVFAGNVYEDEIWKWEDGDMSWDEWVKIHPGEGV